MNNSLNIKTTSTDDRIPMVPADYDPDAARRAAVAFEIANSWLMHNDRVVIVDTETTGLDEHAEIIEIAIINRAGEVLLNSLVKPSRPIPAETTAIHGITDDDVRDAPTWHDVQSRVAHIVTDSLFLAWNAQFDMRLLVQTGQPHRKFFPDLVALDCLPYACRCIMELYAYQFGDWSELRGSYNYKKLGDAARAYGILPHGAVHRALTDARMALGVLTMIGGEPISRHAEGA